jgi:hypothetical protein
MKGWATKKDGYEIEIGDRKYFLTRNTSRRTYTIRTSWISIGAKPRGSTSSTWYNVHVYAPIVGWRRLQGFASDAKAASAAALRHSNLAYDAELAGPSEAM